MNELEVLRERIFTQFPTTIVLDYDPSPAEINRPSYLMIENAGRKIAIEWRPGQGFAISGYASGEKPVFGEGPRKVFEGNSAPKKTFEEAVRIIETTK